MNIGPLSPLVYGAIAPLFYPSPPQYPYQIHANSLPLGRNSLSPSSVQTSYVNAPLVRAAVAVRDGTGYLIQCLMKGNEWCRRRRRRRKRQEAANFASHRRRGLCSAALSLCAPLQNIISGSHLELSISNPRAATAATLTGGGVCSGGLLFPVDAFSFSSSWGRRWGAPRCRRRIICGLSSRALPA